jgi:hypothetical protein
VLENVTRHQLMEHLAQVLPPVQAALVDPDPAVREAAGGAFGVLFKGGAGSAVDAVVPSLLAGLDSAEHHGPSVEGLRVILGVRPAMFNSMLPKLLSPPLTSTALTAIGELAPAAGGLLEGGVESVRQNVCGAGGRLKWGCHLAGHGLHTTELLRQWLLGL